MLYDLAFLLMDLVERDLAPAANVAFNRYLVESGRDENLDALAETLLGLPKEERARLLAKLLGNGEAG